jgi:hypothetical protein
MTRLSIPSLPRSWLIAVAVGALTALLLVPRLGTCAEAPALAVSQPGGPGSPPSWRQNRSLTSPPSACPPSSAAKQWYGYQLMIADATSIGIIALSAPRRLDDLAGFGAVSLVLAPAIIHALHRRWWQTAASPAIRIVSPLLIGLLWYAANPCSGKELCGLDAIALCGGIGMVMAMVVDYVWAWKPVTVAPAPEPKQASARRNHAIEFRAATVAPVDGGGAKLVLGGSF